MTEITSEMWLQAINNAQNRLREWKERITDGSMFTLFTYHSMCGRFALCEYDYENGDRSTELYNALMEL